MVKKTTAEHSCKECALCEELTEQRFLSLKEEPTLGRCPHWTESRSVLLSWKHNCSNFKGKK